MSDRGDWETPLALFVKATLRFGLPDVDACASAQNALAPEFWTVEDSCLGHDWGGREVWCNPPYGRALPPIIRHALSHSDLSVTFLVAARTDTRWFQDLAERASAIVFLKGRQRFTLDAGKPQGIAPFPSAILRVAPGAGRVVTFEKW